MSEVDKAEFGGQVALSIDSLVKTYGNVRAVNELSLTIGVGEIVALLGPNGAGKSTTVDITLGLIKPDQGTVRMLGLDPKHACSNGRVGAMLQSGGLPTEFSVEETLRMVSKFYPSPLPVSEVASTAGITELLSKPTNELSGGEAQRVRFGLAIIPDPDFLILDEPTAAMDVSARRAFWAAMRAWSARGKTLVFATHYLEEADSYADRIVLMNHGQIVADGPTTEIKALAGGRSVRFTLAGADQGAMSVLPGVQTAEIHGETVVLACSDSDATLRAVISAYPAAIHFEVSGAGLDEAFMALTSDEEVAGK